MTIKPYYQCATRLENRGAHPPTAKYVANLVEGLQAACVEASWHSAVDPKGRPLFVSKVFPDHHPQAVLDDLLGLRSRRPGRGGPTLEPVSFADRWITFKGGFVVGEPIPDVEMVAPVVERTTSSWDAIEDNGEPAAEARSGLSNQPFALGDGGHSVTIPRLELHDVILVKVKEIPHA